MFYVCRNNGDINGGTNVFVGTQNEQNFGTIGVLAATSGEMSAERELFVSIWAQGEEGGCCQKAWGVSGVGWAQDLEELPPSKCISAKIIRKDVVELTLGLASYPGYSVS